MVSDGHDAGDDDYDTHVIFFFSLFLLVFEFLARAPDVS